MWDQKAAPLMTTSMTVATTLLVSIIRPEPLSGVGVGFDVDFLKSAKVLSAIVNTPLGQLHTNKNETQYVETKAHARAVRLGRGLG